MKSLPRRLGSLSAILSKPRFAAAFVLSSVALFAVYSTTANFFVLGTLQLNPLGLEPLAAMLLTLLALGGGMLAAVWLHSREFGAKTCAAGVAGGSLGFLSSACPVCPPLAAYFLGVQSLYFLSAYGVVFALASVALVYYGLYQAL